MASFAIGVYSAYRIDMELVSAIGGFDPQRVLLHMFLMTVYLTTAIESWCQRHKSASAIWYSGRYLFWQSATAAFLPMVLFVATYSLVSSEPSQLTPPEQLSVMIFWSAAVYALMMGVLALALLVPMMQMLVRFL